MRVIFLLFAILGASAVFADEPEPFPDFTFKRVGLPDKGSPRITVQVDPSESDEFVPEEETAALPQEAPEPAFSWFWDEVSPNYSARSTETSQTRFEKAIAKVSTASSDGTLPAPRLDALRDITIAFAPEILSATVGTRVSPALVASVIYVESRGKVDAVSSAGAQGLMQLIPATADRFGVTDSMDASQNIKGGVAYLEFLIETFDGDPILTLAAYNAGENAVKNNAGVPPYAETRGYVPKVLSAWTVARALCVTQPELISDGCVFANPGSG